MTEEEVEEITTTPEVKKPELKDQILFYITAFFLLLATFSLFGFLFLVPFFIEPALATIYMDFDPTPVMCTTIEANFLRGVNNCSWSSCREGCTKEVFECTQIKARYRVPSRAVAASSPAPDETPEEDTDLESDNWRDAKLQPNVKGCGYPPAINCAEFYENYVTVGTNFSCYYSLVEPGLVITQLDIEQMRSDLIYCLTIPIFSFVVSVIYLFYAYFKIYGDVTPPPTVCAADEDQQNLTNEEFHNMTSPLSQRSFGGHPRFGHFQSHYSPYDDRTKIIRRAKSGGAIGHHGFEHGHAQHGHGHRPQSYHPPTAGMRLSKSMGDQRKLTTGPAPASSKPRPVASDAPYDVPSKESRTSLGNRNNTSLVNSPSPSEEEPTLPV